MLPLKALSYLEVTTAYQKIYLRLLLSFKLLQCRIDCVQLSMTTTFNGDLHAANAR